MSQPQILISRVSQQSLGPVIGKDLAARCCAPTAFYMLLRANGYIAETESPESFCAAAAHDIVLTDGNDWSRPALSQWIRRRYGAGVVSWQLNGPNPPNFDLMEQSGYIETEQERRFYVDRILGKSVQALVRSGMPVIVTVKPGFGTSKNRNIHAVILTAWDDTAVTVVDPDARNPHQTFTPKHVRDYLSAEGAGSIILPKTA